MKVYVTVGTTSFDELIQAIDQPSVQEILMDSGYTEVLMQIGRGEYTPSMIMTPNEKWKASFYRFKPNIANDMKDADLVISHAGAGSIVECLRLKRPLIVVVNETLMDNHQVEVAQAMEEKNYLRWCSPEKLRKVLTQNKTEKLSSVLQHYPEADYHLFPALVDKQMGFSGTDAGVKKN